MRTLNGIMLAALTLVALALTGSPAALSQQALSPAQLARLAPRTGPAPGIYLMRVAKWGPGACLGYRSTGSGEPYLGAVNCNLGEARIAIEGSPIRNTNAFTIRAGAVGAGPRYTVCASVARGVVFGPPRIDMLGCQMPADARDDCDTGWFDQRFTFERISATRFKVFTVNGDCMAARDDDVVQWGCEASADQNFELVYQGPVTAPVEAQCVAAQGWRSTPQGPVRAQPTPGINLYGGDYLSKVTFDDGGMNCAQMCAEDTRCRAFSWVRPAGKSPDATCWLKDRTPPPSANPDTASGIVRP